MSLQISKKLLLTGAVLIVGIGIGFGSTWAWKKIAPQNLTTNITTTTNTQTKQPATKVLPSPQKILTQEEFKNLLGEDDLILGAKDAPITIIEFNDFQCTYCKMFFENTFALLKTTYIDTGKVRLIYKHFPLIKKNPQALLTAQAMECAGQQDQEKAWVMHDTLFEKTPFWFGNDNATEIITGYTSEIGLDATLFTECINNKKTENSVMGDLMLGQNVGVTATPTFIITTTLSPDAKMYKGFLTFAKLSAILSQLSQ